MTDEPITIGELARRVDDRLADIRDDIKTIGESIERRVSLERYSYESQARDERIKALEDAAKEKERQRQHDRRLIFSALIAPVLMVLLTVYLGAKGATA